MVLGGANGLANPPLAFDFSHNDHRGGQAFMWQRILGTVDELIDLLKSEPFDATTGETMWDRTMIYVATDFGRTRVRPRQRHRLRHRARSQQRLPAHLPDGEGQHHPRRASTPTPRSPTASTPAPAPRCPGKMTSNEPDIYSGVLTAMGADLTGSGLPDASAFKKV